MNKYYWKFHFIYIIQLFLSLQHVYASTSKQQERKHSTAHYFQNGTVYILGGIGMINATLTEQPAASAPITLRFDEKVLSLSSYSSINLTSGYSQAGLGHSSHQLTHSDSIISIFGLQKEGASPVNYIPSSATIQNITPTVQPTGRFHHTSILLEDKIYVIGGKSTSRTRSLIPSQDMIWTYSLSSLAWNRISTSNVTSSQLSITGMAGHVTIVYDQWIISCFGEGGLNEACSWFDTITLKHTKVTRPRATVEWPAARSYASVVSLSRGKFLLFGGEADQKTIFDDVWQLFVNANFSMAWKRIQTTTTYKRSGHASVLLAKNNSIILIYGGQDGPNSLATEPIYFSIENMDWTQRHDGPVVVTRQYGVELGTNAVVGSDHMYLSGGAIGGIIVSIICVVGLGIGFFVWKKRYNRQQRFKNSNSRAARFSRSPSPSKQEQQEKHESSFGMNFHRSSFNSNRFTPRESTKLPSVAARNEDQQFLSLPELALYNNNSTKHNSVISLGGEFQFSTDDFLPRPGDSSISRYSKNSSSVPKIEFIESDSNKIELQDDKNIPVEEKSQPGSSKSITSSSHSTSSSGLKRLTLNLFSSNKQLPSTLELHKKKHSSSLFQLRSSHLLHPSTPSTPDGRYPLRANLQSRVSLGAKSVASIQWVGFNDSMDHGWRDSTSSSLHLAVKNAQRASSHYTSDSTQSTPKSPMFPQHLRDSAIQYQLSDLENSAWKSSSDIKKSSSISVV